MTETIIKGIFLHIMSSIVIQLGSGVLKELLSSTGVAPEEVNEVILGQVGSKLKRRVKTTTMFAGAWRRPRPKPCSSSSTWCRPSSHKVFVLYFILTSFWFEKLIAKYPNFYFLP